MEDILFQAPPSEPSNEYHILSALPDPPGSKNPATFLRVYPTHPSLSWSGTPASSPVNDSPLQPAVDMMQLHVLLHQRVVWVEGCICRVHVVDDRAHAAHDGGETHDGQQEVAHHEEVLLLAGWQRRVAHGGQDQRGEVKAIEVLAPQPLKARLRGVGVHPDVTPEAQGPGQGEVEAAVPVDDHKNVKHQLGDAEGVRVGGAGLRAVKGLKEAGRAQKAV